MRVDFQELKSRVSLEQVAELLGIELKSNGGQLRGNCPACNTTDMRSLVITQSKGWYCFKAQKGGDQLSLVGHIRGCSIRESAEYINQALSVPQEKRADKEQGGTFDPEQYVLRLDRKHALVTALGFTEADCLSYGLGVSAKGAHMGRFCIPIRDQQGKIVVFISVTELKLPKRWRDG